MTTPSETRAAQRRALNGALDRLAFYCDDNATRRSDVAEVRMLVEALAASEPGEALVTVEVWEEFAGKSCYKLTQHDGFRALPNGVHHLYTHPAPEQSGKGEAVQPNEVMVALRKRVSDAGTQAKFALQVKASTTYVSDVLAGKREIPEDWVFCMGYRKGGWVRCNTELMTTPQPSDPAEGDALTFDQWFTNNWPKTEKDAEAGVTNACSVKMVARDAWEAALSTPPTAAVSAERFADRLMVMADTMEAGGDLKGANILRAAVNAALTAALDPQVKR